MTKLILSTGNIVSGGPSIIRKPGAYRSNLELTNSLRSNFLAAQQDYADAAEEALPATNGHVNGTRHDTDAEEPTVSGRTPIAAWTSREGSVLHVPRIDWSAAGLQEEASAYEITVKIFFLPMAPASCRPQFVAEALDLVRRELGVDAVDLLIASFPGVAFEGDCEWEADKRNATQGNLDEEVATWATLEELQAQGLARNLGIAEFGSQKLARFMERVRVRPTVDQINVRDCCNVPPPLAKLARDEGIELLVHSDCTDVLPGGTLRELLGQGLQGAGILAGGPEDEGYGEGVGVGGGGEGLRGDLTPEWVVKYTAFVKDRGVIENKGYFAGAELSEE